MRRRLLSGTLLIVGVLLLSSCSVNPFDESQVPRIDVRESDDGKMVITWEPQGAWHVRVLEGEVDPKDPAHTRPPSRDVVWAISERERPVRSPVVVGEHQTGTDISGDFPVLERGATYTVYVLRHDPKGSGGGFTNTHNVYEKEVVVVW